MLKYYPTIVRKKAIIMDILMLYPTVRRTLWGGQKLINEYGFETKDDNIAEAWLLSCHKDGPSYVIGGKYDGKTLAEVVEAEGKGILGTNNADRPTFPILIKIIDACDKLSIQVHPGDEYAWKYENENGKTEAWYVLSAEPGATLIYGVNKDISKADFEKSIEDNTLLDNFNIVEVKAGDVVFIPSGMIHAIGAGILLAEVQQSSNTTYRIYDYNRPDAKTGTPRPLHVKQACDVSTLTKTEADFSAQGKTETRDDAKITYLTGCDYFKMISVELDGSLTDTVTEKSFVSLLVLDGEGTLCGNDKTFTLKKGSSAFIPAGFGEYKINGTMKILKTEV